MRTKDGGPAGGQVLHYIGFGMDAGSGSGNKCAGNNRPKATAVQKELYQERSDPE